MTEFAIRTDSLGKSYGDIAAVRGLNLRVPRGSIYGFLGRNGAGKTTTIKMLSGLARPTRGSAHVLGVDIAVERIAVLQRTAFVTEKKTLYPTLTVSDLVRFSRGFYRTWSDTAVEKFARLFDIPMKQKFDKLSNGNQTKAWLLLALAQGAELLILDEPTTALDPVTVDQLLRVLVQEQDCTIFFSSHQLEEVERIAQYVGVIRRGELMLESSLDDIKTDFRLITAAGAGLPARTSDQILSLDIEQNFYRYVITNGADSFVSELSRNGATVTSVSPLSLREIFLHLEAKN